MLLKNPALIADDLTAMMSKVPAWARFESRFRFKADLATSSAGEVPSLSMALSPVQAGKSPPRFYYPDRLASLPFEAGCGLQRPTQSRETGDLQLTRSTPMPHFYKLKFEKLPWEANWTSIDGYMAAAATRTAHPVHPKPATGLHAAHLERLPRSVAA